MSCPHTRGDDPLLLFSLTVSEICDILLLEADLFTVSTLNCGAVIEGKSASLVPTRVGMIKYYTNPFAVFNSCPHTRGDDPA